MTLAPDLLTLARARVDGRARPPVGCRAVNGRLGRGKQRVPKPEQAGQSRSKPGPSQVQAGQNQDKAVECMPYVCRMSLGLKTRVASISASISGESARTADLPALSAHVSAQVRSSPLKSAGSLARSLGHLFGRLQSRKAPKRTKNATCGSPVWPSTVKETSQSGT